MSEIDYRTTNHNIFYMGKKYAGVEVVTNKLYEENVTYTQLTTQNGIEVSTPFYININDRDHYSAISEDPDVNNAYNWERRYEYLESFMSRIGFNPASGQTAGTPMVLTSYYFYRFGLASHFRIQASANGMYLRFLLVQSDDVERTVLGDSQVAYFFVTRIKNEGILFNIENAPYEDTPSSNFYPYHIAIFYEEKRNEWTVIYADEASGTRYIRIDAPSHSGSVRALTLKAAYNYQPYPNYNENHCVLLNYFDGTDFYDNCYLLMMGKILNTLHAYRFTFNNKTYVASGYTVKTNNSAFPLVFEV